MLHQSKSKYRISKFIIPCSLFIIHFFGINPLYGNGSAQLIEQANNAYTNGDFVTAKKVYEQVLAEGYEAAPLYYNLGNACYKLGNVPGAIINYERAKKLDPADEDIDFNLELANLKTVDKIEPLPELFVNKLSNDIQDLFPYNTWGLIAIIALWIAALIFALYKTAVSVSLKKLFLVASLLISLTSMMAFGFGYKKYKAIHQETGAIIFSPAVTIKSSPDEKGTDLFVLHEGTKVMVLDEKGQWYKIKLADGSIGWLQLNAVEKI